MLGVKSFGCWCLASARIYVLYNIRPPIKGPGFRPSLDVGASCRLMSYA
jgi:hypothetical protein